MDELNRFQTVSLDELNAHAELLRRFDTKYLVDLQQLPNLLTILPESTLILENAGKKVTAYTTHYYDSADLHTYYDHLKQRRKRFKIRTRHYGEPTYGFLEIKIKKPRGQTEKVRWNIDLSTVGETLTSETSRLLNGALISAHYSPLVREYHRVLQTNFSRATLFEPTSRERITIDTHLLATRNHRSLELGPQHAIIEIKSPHQVGHSHRIFSQLGICPMSISKYCLAMTALEPSLGGAPWREPLRILGISTSD